MDELIIYRIDTLLDHIDLVLKDTEGLSINELEEKNLLLRATCFSIAQIGEMMVQLHKYLANEYPNLPWDAAKHMRNVIVHDYGHIDIEQIYSTIHNDLPVLKILFLNIKKNI